MASSRLRGAVPSRQKAPMPVEWIVGIVVALAVALAAAAYGIVALVSWWQDATATCVNQGTTLLLHEGGAGECVGFTEGSYPFDPRLAPVERLIAQEDQQITAAHPDDYVSVVLLLPLSASAGSIMSMTNAVEELRGAYTAQMYANSGDLDGDGTIPYIQLLIGNDGYEANQWQPATRFIINAVPTQHVAAVAGLGLSLDTTQHAAEALAGAGIPVIGATVTADTFDNIRNMVRVSPANQDGIGVGVSYIRTLFSRAMLVQDENLTDTYDETLVTGFERFPDATHQIVGRETYDSTSVTAGGSPGADAAVQTRLAQMVPDICTAQPAAVLFGGRGRYLAALVADLADRPCLDKPITLISGDDVTNATVDAGLRRGLASGVTVDYAGIAHPDEWSHTTGTSPAIADGKQGFGTFDTRFEKLFPGAPLDDGNTMMAYDAVLTGESAIRLTAQPRPAPFAVADELGALQGVHTVLGSSGPLAFTADYNTSDIGSNPVGKAIPILRLGPDGTSHFVALQWPSGQPPAS